MIVEKHNALGFEIDPSWSYFSTTHLKAHVSHLLRSQPPLANNVEIWDCFRQEFLLLTRTNASINEELSTALANPHEYDCMMFLPQSQMGCTCIYSNIIGSPRRITASEITGKQETVAHSTSCHVCEPGRVGGKLSPLARKDDSEKQWTYCKHCGKWLEPWDPMAPTKPEKDPFDGFFS